MKEWLRANDACQGGYEWAVKNCKTMQDVWDTAKPEWFIWVATQEGVLQNKELHKFGLWCANQVRHLMTDEGSLAALDAKQKWLDGEITDDELELARGAAWAAAGAAAWDSAKVVAWDSARAAAEATARDTAWSAAWSAAEAAARAAARAAAWDVARGAARNAAWAAAGAVAAMSEARVAQAEYLRKNFKPDFNNKPSTM